MSIKPTLEITFNNDCEDFKSKIVDLVANYTKNIFNDYKEWKKKKKQKAYKIKE